VAKYGSVYAISVMLARIFSSFLFEWLTDCGREGRGEAGYDVDLLILMDKAEKREKETITRK